MSLLIGGQLVVGNWRGWKSQTLAWSLFACFEGLNRLPLYCAHRSPEAQSLDSGTLPGDGDGTVHRYCERLPPERVVLTIDKRTEEDEGKVVEVLGRDRQVYPRILFPT